MGKAREVVENIWGKRVKSERLSEAQMLLWTVTKAVTFFSQKISEISTNYNCNFKVFPLNCMKHIRHSSRKISSPKTHLVLWSIFTRSEVVMAPCASCLVEV